jgi:ubiquinone/menaquinone biosynthesis C-methylase UbiE
MALNFDGVFNRDGYYEQARIVDEHIHGLNAKRVLELASGKGFNSAFLAERNPTVDFTGVDLTPSHVFVSSKRATNIPNLHFELGSFQNLTYETQTFDLLFEVESICHATDMKSAISEAFRVLKPGGYFVLFDGFRKPEFSNFTPDQKTAAQLTELAMAVGKPWQIDHWLEIVQSVGFTVNMVKDISQAIMPNLMRFQFLASGFFKSPMMSKAILNLLPDYLVQNAIAGLLMPFTVTAGLQGYYKIVLTRK